MRVISKNNILALSLGLSMPISSLALAQGPAATPAPASGPAASKIGIVNIQDAIANTNEGKKEFDALQARFTPKQTELKGLNDELEGLKKSFEAQRDKLSPEASASQAKTIENKQKILQRNYEDAQAEFQQAEQEVVNRIGSKMLNVLESCAKDKVSFRFLDVPNPKTRVLWTTREPTITKKLGEPNNAESGVPAPPAKQAAATPPRPAPPRPAATPAATPKKP